MNVLNKHRNRAGYSHNMVELSKDEIANGWDKKSLEKYLKEREDANSKSIVAEKIVKPTEQVSYRPLRWRE